MGFASGGRRTTSVLVDGEYPKIRSLFPESSPIQAVVDTAALVEASRRVALVAEAQHALRMVFTEARSPWTPHGDDASANESVPCTLEGEDITVRSTRPTSPRPGRGGPAAGALRLHVRAQAALLTGVNQEDGVVSDYRYLVMPVRIA